MNFDAVRRHVPAILAVLVMGGLVVVGLSMCSPNHGAVLDAAMVDLVSYETLSGTIRIETLVASDTLGLADPQALVQASTAFQATHQLGMPECNVILAQCVAYLAKAPKSNALYVAYGAVQKDIRERPNDPVPLHLRNAPTKLMKNLGYGKGYVYTPDDPAAQQDFLPERLRKRNYLDE